MQVDQEIPVDKVFQELFSKHFNLITEKDLNNSDPESINKMDEYTSNFFKIVIRIFQTSRKFLNMDMVKTLVDQLITGDKLLVIVNSLPLYFAIQMFFETEKINQNETGPTNIITKVYDVIENELTKIKQGKMVEDPLLLMYRLKNLIMVSTSMLQYFLCFQTPFSDKSSSS